MTSHRYSSPWEDSDVIFVVEDEQFHCHHSILKINSPVFRAMFGGDYQESTNRPVPLPGKQKTSFIVFLDLLYPISHDTEITTDRTILRSVLDYAQEYQIDSMKFHVDNSLCLKTYLSKSTISESDLPAVMSDLLLADTFGLRETRDVCVRHLVELTGKNSVMSLAEGTVFNELCGDTKFELLCKVFGEFVGHHTCGNCAHKNIFRVMADMAGVDVHRFPVPSVRNNNRLSKF